jgi:hypothetical protein
MGISGRLLTRSLLCVAAAIMVLSSGCEGEDTGDTASAVTTGGAGGGSNRFGDSACAGCLEQTCSNALETCSGEPGCVAYLECINDCELTEAGLSNQQCEAACREPKGSAAKAALSAYTNCRYVGDGSYCPECGFTLDTLHPVLVQQCDDSTTNEPCGACLDEHCCNSIDSCVANDANCTDLVACQQDCSDAPCVANCYDTYATELEEYLGGATCGGYHCFEACTTEPLSPCANCQLAACPNSYVVCGLDPECFKLQRCLGGCTTPECADDCRKTVPLESLVLHDALLDCIYQHCSLPCS